jgi:hypothetical protein
MDLGDWSGLAERWIPQLVETFASDCTVRLANGGGTVTLRLAIGRRSARRPEELTGGIAQSDKVAIVMIADWDAAAGRAPVRGDVIEQAGRRYGVVSAEAKTVGATDLIYKIGISG